MGRFNRFLHLEREREPDGKRGRPPEDDSARASRFDAVQTQGTSTQGTGSAEGHLARFEEPAPGHAAPALEKVDGDQPFLRCARCEGDSHRRARECQHCHADLDTPEQRAFNEAHWKALVDHREEQDAALLATRRTVDDDEARLKRALTESGRNPLEKLIAERLRQDWKPWSVKLGSVELPVRRLIAPAAVLLIFIAAASRSCGS